MEATSLWPSTSSGLLLSLGDGENPEAWQQFWEGYSPVLKQFARRRGLQDADAQDLVQQVMLAVSRKMEGFRYAREQGRFRSWLATIALRALWKQRTRDQRRPVEFVDAGRLDQLPAGPEGILEDLNAALNDAAMSAIQSEYSEEKWNTFVRLWIKDEPTQAVAKQIGRPPNWVYKVKHEVLKRLEQEVKRIRDDLPCLDEF